MNIAIYHCRKCLRLWSPKHGATELFHYAYLPERGITLSFKCCNEEMYLIKPQDRVLLISETLNTINAVAEDEPINTLTDTVYMPVIGGPVTPPPDTMPTDIAPTKKYGLFSLPSRLKEVAS